MLNARKQEQRKSSYLPSRSVDVLLGIRACPHCADEFRAWTVLLGSPSYPSATYYSNFVLQETRYASKDLDTIESNSSKTHCISAVMFSERGNMRSRTACSLTRRNLSTSSDRSRS
ncbi:hypothetical protein IG631_11156 [Alternaria alternata]|nr:hypothetical protein IG631_11156 [Alternaria alternata]